jgi:signal transduction histidine kinase
VKWLTLLVVAAFALCPGRAARPYEPRYGDPLREPWQWREFADMNGLEVQAVAEGKDGTLWFGTADGLSSYDGFEWTRHLATDGGVLAGWVATMCVEADGTLNAAGWWGISQFRDGHWSRLVPAVGLRFADIRRMTLAADGTLWAATSWGALRRRYDVWTLFTDAANATRLAKDDRYRFLAVEVLPDSVLQRARNGAIPTNRADLFDVVIDTHDRVWFGTKAGEILRFDPPAGGASTVDTAAAASGARGASSWQLYNESDGLTSGRVPSMLATREGSVWVTTAPSDRVNVFDGTTWKTLALPEPGVAPDGARLLQTKDGVIWLSVRYQLFAYRDGEWQVYTKPAAPVPTALNLLLQSQDGALWLVGPNTDIQRIDYQAAHWYTLQDLNFQCESPQGDQWFLHRDGRAVLHRGERWTSYGAEDGFIDAAVLLLQTRDGALWAAGSHEHIAATARFDGEKWIRETHPDFSWGIDWRAAFEASDGSLWFGAAVDSSGPKQHRDGILQFRNGTWMHHHQPGRSPRPDQPEDPATVLPASHRPEPIEKFQLLGESRDGKLWAGRNVLVYRDAGKWAELRPTDTFRFGVIESMLTTREGDLWMGTRQYGALRYDGRKWLPFQGKDSLFANSVHSLTQTADGSVWAATDRGFSRFDGNTWMQDALPATLSIAHDGGSLKAAPSGSLWINRYTTSWNQRGWTKSLPPAPNADFWTVCHRFGGTPPQTIITVGETRVSQPGNISILWDGVEPWREPKDVRLQYSFRMDGQPWSAFTSDRGWAFFTLPSGPHHFEVWARDQEFNVDPSPAVLDFVVLPPVWRQVWFIALLVVLGALIATQTVRVLVEKRRLQKAHDELEERVRQRTAQLEHANKELESFAYSVSHDLRAPLRSIDGFSRALLEDYHSKLDEEGRDDLQRVRAAAQRMGSLIDAMLTLSRVTRGALRFAPVNLSQIATEILEELARHDPESKVKVTIAPEVIAPGDTALLRNVMQNLLANAWKFTAKQPDAHIEFGVGERGGEKIYFVRDNGAGFNRADARNLFGAFQRFHSAAEFSGTGIGLATVQRIIHRHGGRVDAESKPGEGALFYFTLPEPL